MEIRRSGAVPVTPDGLDSIFLDATSPIAVFVHGLFETDESAGRTPCVIPSASGGPHLGADLEKGINVLGWAFGRLPETRAFGRFLNARSVGIKDLRFGSGRGSCVSIPAHAPVMA